jgi:basic membrane protein A
MLPAAALVGCGSKTEPASKKPVIAIAYALGGKGDQNYNDAAAKALPQLKQKYEIQEYAPLSPEEYSRALSIVASGDAKLIFCVGFIYDTFVNQMARRYTDKTFCVLDGAPTAARAFGVQFRVREAAALAGAVAADRSRSKILGFVGGSDIPPITPFVEGFEYGARRLQPSVKVLKTYIGSGAEAFTNAARGHDRALELIRQGADVLFHAAGSSGAGVIAAAREKHCLAVGVDVNQSSLAPETVITSVLKRLDVAILRVTDLFFRGIKLPHPTLELGLRDQAVDIVPPSGLSPEGEAAIRALREEFARG